MRNEILTRKLFCCYESFLLKMLINVGPNSLFHFFYMDFTFTIFSNISIKNSGFYFVSVIKVASRGSSDVSVSLLRLLLPSHSRSRSARTPHGKIILKLKKKKLIKVTCGKKMHLLLAEN